MQRSVCVFRLRGRCILPNSSTLVNPSRPDHSWIECKPTCSRHGSPSPRCKLGTVIEEGRVRTVERRISALMATRIALCIGGGLTTPGMPFHVLRKHYRRVGET
jgi:hypothetical protein